MAGEQGVGHLGQDGVLVAENALDQWFPGRRRATALRRTSSLIGHGLPARLPEFTKCLWATHGPTIRRGTDASSAPSNADVFRVSVTHGPKPGESSEAK